MVVVLIAVNLLTLLLTEPEQPRITFHRPAAGGAGVTAPLLYPVQLAEESAEALAEASVKAELLGVISGGAAPRVNMKVKGKKEAVFGLKDEIAPGVVIEAIEVDRVVVRERGVLRQISFAPFVSERAGSILEISAQSDEVESDTNLFDSEPDNAGLSGMASLDDLRLSPILLADGQSGIRVETLADGLGGLGVQPGDVITAVDGTQVVELANRPKELEAISQQDEISLTLYRDGRQISLAVDGDSLRILLGL